MTNWKTISNSIQRLRKLDEILSGEAHGFTKKERLNLERERENSTVHSAASRTWVRFLT